MAQPPAPPGLGPDAGPHPVLRAVVGLGLGAASGLLAALLTPRPERGQRTLPGPLDPEDAARRTGDASPRQ